MSNIINQSERLIILPFIGLMMHRKVIILDYVDTTGLEIIGIGLLIVALAVGYYFIRKDIYNYYSTKDQIIQSPKPHIHE